MAKLLKTSSVKYITEFLNVSMETAQKIQSIAKDETKTNIDSFQWQFPKTNQWINQCVNPPKHIDIQLHIFDELLDGHGIESIPIEDKWINGYWQNIHYLYVNMGDSYIPTIIYDTKNESFILSTFADIMERNIGYFLMISDF